MANTCVWVHRPTVLANGRDPGSDEWNFALGDTGFKRRLALQLGRRVDRGSPGRPSKRDERQDDQAELFDPSGKNVVCP
jgi:hypothetical protein